MSASLLSTAMKLLSIGIIAHFALIPMVDVPGVSRLAHTWERRPNQVTQGFEYSIVDFVIKNEILWVYWDLIFGGFWCRSGSLSPSARAYFSRWLNVTCSHCMPCWAPDSPPYSTTGNFLITSFLTNLWRRQALFTSKCVPNTTIAL